MYVLNVEVPVNRYVLHFMSMESFDVFVCNPFGQLESILIDLSHIYLTLACYAFRRFVFEVHSRVLFSVCTVLHKHVVCRTLFLCVSVPLCRSMIELQEQFTSLLFRNSLHFRYIYV